jgi:glutamine amidotransferase
MSKTFFGGIFDSFNISGMDKSFYTCPCLLLKQGGTAVYVTGRLGGFSRSKRGISPEAWPHHFLDPTINNGYFTRHLSVGMTILERSLRVIAILDYRAGNLTSVQRALDYLGFPSQITDSHEVIKSAERVIFPGVGAAGKSMENLKALGLDDLLRDRLDAGTPVLGICVGLQVLFDYSEENDTPCLAVLPGKTRLFPRDMTSSQGETLKVPHMGWNEVDFMVDHPVFRNLATGSEFYFVHSYYPDPADALDVAGKTTYGISFASAVAVNNLVAVQFHPEKSGPPGLQILRNFCRWNGSPD